MTVTRSTSASGGLGFLACSVQRNCTCRSRRSCTRCGRLGKWRACPTSVCGCGSFSANLECSCSGWCPPDVPHCRVGAGRCGPNYHTQRARTDAPMSHGTLMRNGHDRWTSRPKFAGSTSILMPFPACDTVLPLQYGRAGSSHPRRGRRRCGRPSRCGGTLVRTG